MSDAIMEKILNKLSCLSRIESKLDNLQTEVNQMRAENASKFHEHDKRLTFAKKRADKLEEQVNVLQEKLTKEHVRKDLYDKRLNILLHGT